MASGDDRPRVAFLGYAHDARGGIAQFGRGLAEAVGEHAAVRLIGYRKLYPSFTRPGRQAPDPSRTHRISGPAITVPWSPVTWRETSDEVRDFRADLLVVQWWSPLFGPSVRSVARRARAEGVRTMFICHNDRPHEPFPFWKAITRAALRQADMLATFTDTVAESVRTLAPRAHVDVHALPQGLVAGAGNAGDWDERIGPCSGPVILFFGNVRAYKGLADLVAALPAVRREVDATLVAAGTFFEPLERFRKQAAALGVEEHVRFVADYVPDEEVPALFDRCDVVALPYRSVTASGVLGQAALAGKPVVTTTVGSLPETVGEHGVLVPPHDPAGLAAGIVRALRDPPPPLPLLEDGWEPWRDLVLENARRGDPSARYATA